MLNIIKIARDIKTKSNSKYTHTEHSHVSPDCVYASAREQFQEHSQR